MRRALTFVAGLAAAACTEPLSLHWGKPSPAPTTRAADAALDEAAGALAAGRTRAAASIYERVAREQAGHDAGGYALHELLVLRVDPKSPLRDNHAALALLGRLTNEYPDTHWAREARGWRVLIRSIDRCEAEATQLGADAERLRHTLDSLKDSDVELEQHP